MTDDERSGSGDPILRHEARTGGIETPAHDEVLTAAVEAHIEAHFGATDMVFHEILSDTVHLDIHVIRPTAARPHYTLVTTGMSGRPMQVPGDVPERERYLHAELMLCLPQDWFASYPDEAELEDETKYWPLRLLKTLARFPHLYDSWLAVGHTVPNQEPYAPNTRLDGAVLLAPWSFGEHAEVCTAPDGRTVNLYAVVPLYPEEMQKKLDEGLGALLPGFEAVGLTEVVQPQRLNGAAPQQAGWVSEGDGLSMEQARALQDEFDAVASTDDVQEMFNAAARMMTGKHYREAIAAFEQVAARDSGFQAGCHQNIGACQYFLGAYDKAIQHYEQALAHGADERMMRDNIEEAREAQAGGPPAEADGGGGGGLSKVLMIVGGLVVALVLLLCCGVFGLWGLGMAAGT